MYNKELEFAKNLATKDAGKIMRHYFKAEDKNVVWKKDNTPLTQADTEVNRKVIAMVKQHFPEHGVIGEEESYEPERQLVWVVDPIDGTVPFSLSIPISTFSLALVDRKDGQPLVAVVFDPYLDHLYFAEKGSGSYLNGQILKTSEVSDFKRGYFYISGDPAIYDVGKWIKVITKKGGKCMNLISFAYSGVKVACGGQLTAVCMSYGSPWDSAAVALIVQEAGGVATDLDGKERRYDQFANGILLSANKTIHSKVIDLIKTNKT